MAVALLPVQGSKRSIARRRSIQLSALLSPVTFVAVVALSGALLSIPSPLGWGRQYGVFQGTETIFGYIGCLALGIIVVRLWPVSSKAKSNQAGSLSARWLKIVFLCACVFTIAKFVNVGDIPLLGDPMSRYRHTIGGYADYFARLITPLALLYFLRFQKSRYKDYGALVAILISIILSGLFMQRQDVLFVVVGCITLWARSLKFRALYAAAILSFLAIATYVVIGLGALARYGAATLGNDIPPWLLPVWVIHGEFTVPYRLGDYVTSGVDDLLLGKYSLGQYFTIFGSDVSVGAGYINDNYVGAGTAQSIGAPYSFILDFGASGGLVMGFLTGIILAVVYEAFRKPDAGPLALAMYPLLLLQAFWSVRSGEFLLSSIALFGFLAILVSTNGGSGTTIQVRNVVRPMFVGALCLAAVTLVARI